MNLLLAAVLLSVPAVRAGAPDRETVKAAQIHYLQGMMLEKRGSYAEALKSYEQALEEDPNSAYICRETADLALEMGMADKALQFAKRAVELEPKAAEGHVLMGRIYWAKGEVEAARTAFEEALKLDPKSGESIFSLGSILAAKSPDKARKLLEDFLKENPAQAAEAHYQIAKIDIDAGHYHEAEQHLKTAIDLEPDTDALPVRYALAQAYEARRSTDEALGAYLEILKGDPRNVALINHIGEIFVVKDKWDEARSYFLSAKALQPAEPSANHWLALDAERRGDFAAASNYLKASSALMEDPGLSLRLSYYLTQAGRLKEAVTVLEKAHKRWPENDQVTYFLALGYEDVKRDPAAVDLLKSVVALKPDWREARYQLAVLLEKGGDIAAAEKEFRALLARKPDDAAILNYLGYSLADRGLKLDEAEQMIREALRLEPQNGAYVDSLGWVHFKQGRSTEAVKELLEAAALLPEDESVWEHVGDAYKKGGLPASAWFAYKRSESLAAPEARKPAKAGDLQGGFTAEQLGAYYLDYLKVTQGALRKVSGVCDITGEILGRPFSYRGLVTYRGPEDFTIEILGPMFTPMFKLRWGKEGFSMDPLRIEGLDPKAVRDAARASVAAFRDYLSGAVFESGSARYHRGWRRREIVVPGRSIVIDSEGLRAVGVRPEAKNGIALSLEDFERKNGRQFPRGLVASGKEFTFGIRFSSFSLEAGTVPAAAPPAKSR